jgi:hypothetical protein
MRQTTLSRIEEFLPPLSALAAERLLDAPGLESDLGRLRRAPEGHLKMRVSISWYEVRTPVIRKVTKYFQDIAQTLVQEEKSPEESVEISKETVARLDHILEMLVAHFQESIDTALPTLNKVVGIIRPTLRTLSRVPDRRAQTVAKDLSDLFNAQLDFLKAYWDMAMVIRIIRAHVANDISEQPKPITSEAEMLDFLNAAWA